MIKELSIIITTFNRRDRLIRQLRSIYKQTIYNQVNIIILDNCSDYDITETLNSEFSNEELSVLELVIRPYNIGMLGNISNAFTISKTKWMWLLSDDDETTEFSICKILELIKKYPNILSIKFSKIRQFQKKDYGEKRITSIRTLLDFCISDCIDLGNLIFMSNNVYNNENLKPYIKDAFTFSYTYFPHIVPILLGLCDNKKDVIFVSDSIVKYVESEIPPSYDYLVSIYLGALSIADIPFDICDRDYKDLLCFFEMNPFWQISNDFYHSTFSKKKHLYKKVYSSYSNNRWCISNWFTYNLFKFQMTIGSNFISNFILQFKKIVKMILNIFF